MRHSRALRRVGLGVLILVILLATASVVAVTSLVRQSFPQTSGQIRLPDLAGDVSVVRDEQGVPHIYADNATDLFRAQGFVAAQDRFFQMDLRRHIASGRLAELIGSAGVESDRAVRTLGWRQVAEQELPTLSSATRQYLNAYAEGVNDYISRAAEPSQMSLEYAVLTQQAPGHRVEKWTPVDSLTWLKAMAWTLKANYAEEVTRGRLSGELDPATLAALYPPYPSDEHAPILSVADWRPEQADALVPQRASRGPATAAGVDTVAAEAALRSAQDTLDSVWPTLGSGDGIGSNSWVVSPSRSTTGHALLANDPHLATDLPGVWHQASLHCRSVSAACPFDVTGFSFAGVPGIVIGHNARIAWGFTNLAADVTDLYYEKITDSTFLRDGQQVPLSISTERIEVAGGEDVELTIRRTNHGPIVSDFSDAAADAGARVSVAGQLLPESYAVSLAWTGLVPSKTADAIFALDAAASFDDFRAAASQFAAPSQNLVYADVDGHIGYQAPGLVPIRRSSALGYPPGYLPSPGWQSAWDWTGFVPFENMPWSRDPVEGFLVAANQQVTAADSPYLTTDWDLGYRSQRIRELLEQNPTISPEQMAQIQNDNRNDFAPVLVSALLGVDLGDDPFTEQGQELLKSWDFTQPVDGDAASAAAYYNAVWQHVLDFTFDDQLGVEVRPDGGSRWMRAVSLLLSDPSNPWWDDRRTPGVIESKDEILRRALAQARLDLTMRLGKDPQSWSWGRLHTLDLRNRVLGQPELPGLIRTVFVRGPIPLPGGPAVVNANSWDASDSYQVVAAPSMRMVVDLGDFDASTWVNQTGVSGHVYSEHYLDQVDAWAAGRSFSWPFSKEAVDAARVDELVLSQG